MFAIFWNEVKSRKRVLICNASIWKYEHGEYTAQKFKDKKTLFNSLFLLKVLSTMTKNNIIVAILRLPIHYFGNSSRLIDHKP